MATILFATPHQDDESLSMGSAIRAHLEAGHDVHTLLCTTGQNSAVRTQLGWDVPTFVAARDDEYTRAARRLGVRFPNIHIAPARTEDGALTVAAAELILTAWLADHPGAWVKTLSSRPAPGRHADHVNLGQAAKNLLTAGTIVPNGLRMYVEPYQRSAWIAANPGVALSPEHASGVTVVRGALGEYQARDSAGGKYAIGDQSVGDELDAAIADPTNYYHLP